MDKKTPTSCSLVNNKCFSFGRLLRHKRNKALHNFRLSHHPVVNYFPVTATLIKVFKSVLFLTYLEHTRYLEHPLK